MRHVNQKHKTNTNCVCSFVSHKTELVMKLSSLQSKTLDSFSSKSAKIHYLDKIRKLQNEKISNIGLAKILNIIPQHVYNELARVCKNPKEKWDVKIK